MRNTISFMTANYVAREAGYAMHGWGHGDRLTNEAFRPLETYEQKLDELLGGIRALGFDAIDLWGGHLNPAWATAEHLAIAQGALERHGLRVVSLATFVEKTAPEVERACDVAAAVGTTLFGGLTSAPRETLLPILRERGMRLGIENHPEKTPDELRAKIGDDADVLGATVDTGWFATHGYDPARAVEELGDHVFHVHLKDVLKEGEHDTCRWGDGVVDAEACVRALRRMGYVGAISVEHEPETYDPTDDVRDMRALLEGWLR